jgi:hypothetical protein
VWSGKPLRSLLSPPTASYISVHPRFRLRLRLRFLAYPGFSAPAQINHAFDGEGRGSIEPLVWRLPICNHTNLADTGESSTVDCSRYHTSGFKATVCVVSQLAMTSKPSFIWGNCWRIDRVKASSDVNEMGDKSHTLIPRIARNTLSHIGTRPPLSKLGGDQSQHRRRQIPVVCGPHSASNPAHWPARNVHSSKSEKIRHGWSPADP